MVEFNILPGSCQPILDENKAKQLQIISMDKQGTSVFNPVKMIDRDKLNGELRILKAFKKMKTYPVF